MNTTLLEKARENRKGAVTYVAGQKARLVKISAHRRNAGPRMPFPSIGFYSTRLTLHQTGTVA